MSNKTITQLPSVTSVTATDVIPIVQNNVTSKILASNLTAPFATTLVNPRANRPKAFPKTKYSARSFGQ